MPQKKIPKQLGYFVFPFIGFLIGWKLDKIEDERLTRFRDKSALYKREVPPSEPSWS